MKKVSLFLTFCCLAFDVLAMPNREAALPPGSVLEADFIQQRHLNQIPKPIESKGHMILWDGKGLVWSTSTPFPNTLLITQKGLYQLEGSLKTPMVKAGGDSSLFNVMVGIFNMKNTKTVRGFTIKNLPPKDGKWRISLIPQHSQVQNFIQSITMEGNVHIMHITISRPNGDRDEIEITGHAIKEAASQQTRKLFDE